MKRKSNNPGFEKMVRQRRRTEYQLRKDYNIKYDDTWREIMFETADELHMPLDHVVRINTAWWKFVSEMMSRVELVTVKMIYLLTIKPSTKKLFRYCEKMGYMVEGFYRKALIGKEERKIEDVKRMEEHLEVLQETYIRLVKEEKTAKRIRAERKKRGGQEGFVKPFEDKRLIAVRMVEARKMKAEMVENGTLPDDNHRGFVSGIMHNKYKQ